MTRRLVGLVLVAMACWTLSLSLAVSQASPDPPKKLPRFRITDAKMALTVDAERRRPVKITSEFPAGTQTVHCWFAWKDAEPDLPMVARWSYETDHRRIFDSSFALPRLSDRGVVSLHMPQGQSFPPGVYRVDLIVQDHVVKSLWFTVRSVSP